MKKVLLLFFAVITIVACSSEKSGFEINGELIGDIPDSTLVFLKTVDSTRNMIEVDTTLISQNTFQFTGNQDAPKLYYLFFQGIRGNSPIILENGSVSFKAQKDSLAFSKLGGTPQNDMFMTYLEEQRKFADIGKSFNKDLQQAQMEGDQAMIQSLREEYVELQEKSKNFEKDFITQNPNSLVSALILERIAAQKALPVKEIEEMTNGLSEELQTTAPVKRLKKMLDNLKKTAIGEKAPEFSGPQPNGELLALNDVKGKVTLVDFWAGWCRPCRAENPNIVAVYEKYKDKGLNVLGVSLDRNRDLWLQAIEEDNLQWNHVSNVQYFQDPITRLYNINAIPAAFLLDENGIIIAKDLRGKALEDKVAELLN
ncbi:TlpA disulfide reductase family protein [Croceivirga lutea]|uniref:TlpA disulfide reductase family protein n=1 Tax=Croceivirga lutea TaxID=1775167 RepID=UPI00163AC150|nr:TlpA disulfide reductase family protein [Croceivirga lutea]